MCKPVMIGTLVWCPENSISRSKLVIEHLQGVLSTTSDEDRDFYIVDNNTKNKNVIEFLDYCIEIGVSVERFSPQLYWSRGRNCLIDKFSKSNYKGLVLFDSDIIPTSAGWLEKIILLQNSAPFIHTYMISNNSHRDIDHDFRGTIMIDDVACDVYREFTCNTHYMDKKAVKILGGYATKPYDVLFGFCDCDYGRRLKKARINSKNGDYIDPIRMNCFINGDTKSKREEIDWINSRSIAINKNTPIFFDREKKIADGSIPVFEEYKNWRIL